MSTASAAKNELTPESSGDPGIAGAVLWLQLAKGTTRERLIERLAQAYLIDGQGSASDTDVLLQS
jgi:hypothetical protein